MVTDRISVTYYALYSIFLEVDRLVENWENKEKSDSDVE